MISRKKFYLLLFIIIVVTAIYSTLSSVAEFKNQEGLIFSHDKSKSIKCWEPLKF